MSWWWYPIALIFDNCMSSWLSVWKPKSIMCAISLYTKIFELPSTCQSYFPWKGLLEIISLPLCAEIYEIITWTVLFHRVFFGLKELWEERFLINRSHLFNFFMCWQYYMYRTQLGWSCLSCFGLHRGHTWYVYPTVHPV